MNKQCSNETKNWVTIIDMNVCVNQCGLSYEYDIDFGQAGHDERVFVALPKQK